MPRKGESFSRAQASRHAALYRAAVDRNKAEEVAANMRRATDPIERAKTFLRRKGFVCYAASVDRDWRRTRPLGAPDMTVVGNRVMTDQEVLAMARRKGFEG